MRSIGPRHRKPPVRDILRKMTRAAKAVTEEARNDIEARKELKPKVEPPKQTKPPELYLVYTKEID